MSSGKKHPFKRGDRVHLTGDKHKRAWRVMGFPAHGTTILIQREKRAPSPYSQSYADPDELRRLPDTPDRQDLQ